MKRKHPEQDFQRALLKTLGLVLQPKCFVMAIPNGGVRSGIEAAVLVGQGVVPGAPDLLVMFDGRAVGLELKAHKGRLSDSQMQCHSRLETAGIPVGVVRTLPGAITFLKQHGAPTRLVETV